MTITGTEPDKRKLRATASRRFHHRTLVGIPGWAIAIARLASDAGIVLLGFYLAYWLRYSMHVGGEVPEFRQQPLSFFQGKIVLLMLLTVLLFQIRGLYRLPRWTTLLDETSGIASGVTTAMALVILYSFLQQFYPS